jgi:DNA-binding LacI/PurR family transcriptional regulator
MIREHPDLTAVLCYSDLIAESVFSAAAALRRRIPTDLSVVGFDDSPSARLLHPPLTTVRQDLVAKAKLAVAAVTSAGGRNAPKKHVVLPAQLIERGSTAALSSG